MTETDFAHILKGTGITYNLVTLVNSDGSFILPDVLYYEDNPEQIYILSRTTPEQESKRKVTRVCHYSVTVYFYKEEYRKQFENFIKDCWRYEY